MATKGGEEKKAEIVNKTSGAISLRIFPFQHDRHGGIYFIRFSAFVSKVEFAQSAKQPQASIGKFPVSRKFVIYLGQTNEGFPIEEERRGVGAT